MYSKIKVIGFGHLHPGSSVLLQLCNGFSSFANNGACGHTRNQDLEGTSYLKAHPLGNRCPERGSPTYTRTMDRIRTRALGDPSDPKARMVPLYHGGPIMGCGCDVTQFRRMTSVTKLNAYAHPCYKRTHEGWCSYYHVNIVRARPNHPAAASLHKATVSAFSCRDFKAHSS
ncbi:hypothetical protein E2C01_017798 [Portunus trituberculatus]|uniref:Uncharacterized protein n=1 Tax=Portunus trituberculatus TaxID=210409 RepID=A0A5B7DUI6_PORTR|nr:hypothetical protein [Portunus trituberculatus]